METLFAPIMSWLESLTTLVNVEFFVVMGAFLEELIAPIPSPFVMTTAAVLAQVQHFTVLHLAFLILLATIAKTASTYVVYVVADKAEDLVLGKFGKYFGVSHAHIESLGKLLKNHWVDDVLLFLARAIPLVPTFPISVGAGVIKYNVRSYILMTFLGTFIRNILYVWIAYFGVHQFQAMSDELWNHPLWLAIGVIVGLLLIIAIMKAKDSVWDRFMTKLSNRE